MFEHEKQKIYEEENNLDNIKENDLELFKE